MNKPITEEQVKDFLAGMFLAPLIGTLFCCVLIICARLTVAFYNLIF